MAYNKAFVGGYYANKRSI